MKKLFLLIPIVALLPFVVTADIFVSNPDIDFVKQVKAFKPLIIKMADQARADKDIIKLNCLNDKINQIDALIMVAYQKAKTKGIEHRNKQLAIIYNKAQIVKNDADDCVGEDLIYIGETLVEVEVDPNIPEVDLDETSTKFIEDKPPERPPFASGWF